MNILLPIDQYANKHIYFSRPIKNMIINDSNFIGIIYSNNNIVLNYIFFHFNILLMLTQLKIKNILNKLLK